MYYIAFKWLLKSIKGKQLKYNQKFNGLANFSANCLQKKT